MNHLYTLIAAATPSPIPSSKVPDADKVSPGLPGFIMIFLLALAVVILVTSMNKRIRRVRLRDPDWARENEQANGDEHAGDGHADGDGRGPSGPDDVSGSEDGPGERT